MPALFARSLVSTAAIALALLLSGCPTSTPPTSDKSSGSDSTSASSEVMKKAAPVADGPKTPISVSTGSWSLMFDKDFALVGYARGESKGEQDWDPQIKADKVEIKKLDAFPAVKAASAADAAHTLQADGWTITFDTAGKLTTVALGPSGSDADLAELAKFPTITKLTADKREVTDEGMKSVAKMPALRTLDVTLSGITDAGMEHLKSAPKLEDITLKRCDITAEGYKHLAGIKTLKRIRAAQTNFDDTCLAAIAGMSQLELLDLQDCNRVSEQGLAVLKNFPKLRSLRMWGPTITDAVLSYLADAKELRLLSLEQSAVGPEGLAHIAGLTNLTDLKLYGASGVNSRALEHLKGLTKLTTLDLRSTTANNKGMAHLAGLSSLRVLDLSETPVGDAGMAELKKLSNLEDLNLWYSKTGDAGLAHIGELKKLKRLNLDKCKELSDAGLVHLKGLTDLEFLHLGSNPGLTDAGLENLAEMKNLKELVVTFCPMITEDGVKKLQQQLPALTTVKR